MQRILSELQAVTLHYEQFGKVKTQVDKITRNSQEFILISQSNGILQSVGIRSQTPTPSEKSEKSPKTHQHPTTRKPLLSTHQQLKWTQNHLKTRKTSFCGCSR
jgi:hypothetical protein